VATNAKNILLGLLVVVAFGLWNCEDAETPAGTGGVRGIVTTRVARINGAVHDGANVPIYNAKVYRSAADGALLDSTTTNPDGQFVFEVVYTEASDTLNTWITVKKHGYVSNAKSLQLVAGFQYTVDFLMALDLSTSAIVSGVVRDSTTLFPLRNSLVIFSVPGFSDQVVTGVDGTFTFVVDLIDVSTLPVNVTISHSGYQAKSMTVNVNNGQSYSIGSILLHEDRSSTIGTIVGRVLDATNQLPILNASVTLASSLSTDSVLTNGDGAYSFS